MTTTVLLILALFQLRHFVVDYPLQVPRFFLEKFRDDWGFFLPLAAHAGLHAATTALILVAFGADPGVAGLLGMFNGTVHFVMDRLKAGRKYLGRWKALSGPDWMDATASVDAAHKHPELALDVTAPRRRLRDNSLFWVCLGLDQLVHGLTDLACIWFVLTHA